MCVCVCIKLCTCLSKYTAEVSFLHHVHPTKIPLCSLAIKDPVDLPEQRYLNLEITVQILSMCLSHYSAYSLHPDKRRCNR